LHAEYKKRLLYEIKMTKAKYNQRVMHKHRVKTDDNQCVCTTRSLQCRVIYYKAYPCTLINILEILHGQTLQTNMTKLLGWKLEPKYFRWQNKVGEAIFCMTLFHSMILNLYICT
jgi:hypothetical protein